MKKPKMNKPSKNVVLFIIIAFLLPLMIVTTQSRDLNNAIGFVLYGIQAAAPIGKGCLSEGADSQDKT